MAALSLGVGLILCLFSRVVLGSHLDSVIFLVIGSWPDNGVSLEFHLWSSTSLNPFRRQLVTPIMVVSLLHQ